MHRHDPDLPAILAHPDAQLGSRLERLLGELGVRCLRCERAAGLPATIGHGAGGLVLVSAADLPEVTRRLHALPRAEGWFTVVVDTAPALRDPTRLLEEGAVDYVCQAVDDGTLLGRLQVTMHAARRRLARHRIEHTLGEFEASFREVAEHTSSEGALRNRQRLVEGATAALQHLLTDTETDAAMETALRRLGEASGVDRVHIATHREEQLSGSVHVAVSHEWVAEGVAPQLGQPGLPGEHPAFAEGRPLFEALEAGETIAFRVSQLPPTLREWLEPSGTRSALIVPMRAGGTCWGHVGLVDCHEEREWGEAERAILEAAAAAMGGVIARDRAGAEAREQAERIRTLFEATANPTLSMEAQLAEALAAGARLLDMDLAGVVDVDDGDTDACTLRHAHPPEGPFRPGQRVPLERAVWQRSVREGRPMGVGRAEGTPMDESPMYTEHGMRSFIGVPLWTGGRARGALCFLSPRSRPPFRETDIDFVHLMGRWIELLRGRLESRGEQRELERRFREAQKLETLGVLAGGVAHDFNNLLMGILGHAAIALLELPSGAPARESIAQVELAARRAAELTHQMLAYAGRGHLHTDRIDLNALVEEMGSLLSTVISKDAELTFDLAAGLGVVEADAAQIRQVVMNLITNAADALDEGPGRIEVRTGIESAGAGGPPGLFVAEDAPAGDYAFVEVEDTGCGLDDATRDRMFEPFFTTKPAGRGLGLAAVIGIIHAHRGGIRVEAAPGAGTVFRVLLPILEGVQRPATTMAEPWSPLAKLTGRVLVADDMETVRATVSAILQRSGMSVVGAEDGLHAVELVRDAVSSFDAVVLDLTMPRLDGATALLRIRELHPALPAVLMSGYAADERVGGLVAEESTHFLKKPFTPQELVDTLRSVLDRT